MDRTSILQKLIDKTITKKYLEIGMGPGVNYNSLVCDYKLCVDPNPTVPVTHKMTSDEFFEQNKEMFGVIFIDGLHWSEQVYKDILSSLNVLSSGGYVVCHDINPHSEIIQKYPQAIPESEWTGDCWKAWVKIRQERSDLNMFVIDTDYGCGVISRGNQTVLPVNEELTWDLLDKNRKELLNLISIEKFNSII